MNWIIITGNIMQQSYENKYKDVQSHVLENEILRVEILPKWGAKIASIIFKPIEYELLWQNPNKTFKKSLYAEQFAEGESACFDDMFPNISSSYYEKAPWKGIEMPDHGEVWSLPWNLTILNQNIEMEVNGVRFPYRFKKKMHLDEGTIYLSYEVENLSPYQFDFIWSAHPLFNANANMEFIVPEGMDEIVNSVDGKRLGSYGSKYNFPEAILDSGKVFRLDKVPPINDFGYQKYYFTTPVTEGWCSLLDPQNEIKIHLEYPKESVKYLGMWLNEGGYAGQYNIAPEPCTGAMDRVDFSNIWGMNSFMKPFETCKWYLNISVNVLVV